MARPPYPAGLDPLLIELAGGADAHILDLGCGTAELARRLAPRVRAITAVDHSANMIAQARALPGGDAPNMTWVVGRVEDVPLTGPFSSALAGQSFHWFDWAGARASTGGVAADAAADPRRAPRRPVAVVGGARRTLPPLLDQQGLRAVRPRRRADRAPPPDHRRPDVAAPGAVHAIDRRLRHVAPLTERVLARAHAGGGRQRVRRGGARRGDPVRAQRRADGAGGRARRVGPRRAPARP